MAVWSIQHQSTYVCVHTADLLLDEHHLDTCMYVYSIFCACIYVYVLTVFTFPVVLCIGLSTSQAIECNTGGQLSV